MSLHLITVHKKREKSLSSVVPSEVNQVVKMYTPSKADVMPIDLSAKKICFFVAERILAEMFHLQQYPVVRYYVLQHMQ
jgi:hypothetical protein